MKKIVVTHNGYMHADEVMAIALLKVFSKDEINTQRVNHQTEDFSAYDMVIDIGGKFDGIKFFDHHQYQSGKSSAGLIWQYLKLEKSYPKISKLIKLIDDNDVGIKKAKDFEFSNLIKCFNLTKNLQSKEQNLQFDKAVEFSKTVIISLKNEEDEIDRGEKIIKRSSFFDNNDSILKLTTFTPVWSRFLNAEVTPNIKAVVWEDKEEKNWKIQITPKKLNSFTLNAKPLTEDKTMKFVHSSGFFAVANNEADMQKYLRKQFPNNRFKN